MAFGQCPPKPITGGQKIFCSPNRSLDPLGHVAEVDFISGFRTPRNESGPLGKHQGSAGRTWAPRGGSRPRKTNQGPVDGSGSRGTNQGPRNGSGTRNTNQGPAGRIRARRSNRGPRDGSGPRGTNQGPMGRTRTLQDE